MNEQIGQLLAAAKNLVHARERDDPDYLEIKAAFQNAADPQIIVNLIEKRTRDGYQES